MAGGFKFENDAVFPEGVDTVFGGPGYNRILPEGRDATKGEDYTSTPSGALIGERATETLVGSPTEPGRGPDVTEEAAEGE